MKKHTKKAQQDINSIIAKGIAENKSSYDIAKDLEKYVNPSAKKDWDWSKVYPGTNKKVDYNAQRLARTMVSHAYQYSFVQTTKHNPFVEDYIWRSAGSERTCEICAERNGKHYAKDKLPLDHPNGLCTFIANTPDNMEDIADRLADWAHGKSDPELDEFVKSLYGDKWNKPTEPKEMEYRYHATRRSSIVSIIEKGLSPSKGHIGKGVYFAQSIEDALEWTAETSTGGTTVLRVPLDFLLSKGYEEYDADETVYNRAEGLVDHKISFDNIEIKMGDEWMTLTTFAETYRNSVYKNLSSTAQKKVDKQWSKETQEWIKKGVK